MNLTYKSILLIKGLDEIFKGEGVMIKGRLESEDKVSSDENEVEMRETHTQKEEEIE